MNSQYVKTKLGEKAKEVAMEHVKQKAARDILTSIRDWRGDKQLTAKRRWIFELIQNASDTAKARKNNHLKIEIKNDNGSLIFRHNAGYFTLDEISATIYGGSTKPFSPESDYLGRFGTGFLVTHIISRTVKIQGCIKDDGNSIYFFNGLDIDRLHDTEDEISESIDKCFNYLDTAQPKTQSKFLELWTEYIYCSNDSLGLEAIEIGIDELRKNLPFIFAFNRIDEITINNDKFSKKEKIESDIIHVKVGNYVVCTKQDEENTIQVGILIENGKILDLKNKPRLYIGMPLTETADYISIPFIINSFKFDPTRERNALNGDNVKNIELIKKAFDLYEKLLIGIKKDKKISNLFNLLNFQLITANKVSQNPLWGKFNDSTEKTFRRIIEKIPLVDTHEGAKEIKNTIFPINLLNNKEIGEDTFYDFYDLILEIKKNVPIKNELNLWVNVVFNLKKVFPNEIFLYSIDTLKDELEEIANSGESLLDLEDLKKEYNLSDSKTFLVSFFNLVNSLFQNQIVSADFIKNLLPDQDGIISKLSGNWDNSLPYRMHLETLEDPVSDELKNIAEKIGRLVRQELVDKDFSDFDIVKNYVSDLMNTDLVLNNILSNNYYRLPVKIEKWEDKEVEGWIELFRWCVLNDKLTINFPIITKNSEVQILDDLNKETFLIPFKYMGIKEEYEEVYSENKLIHHKYFEIEQTHKDELIAKLRCNKAIVTELPLYKKSMTFAHNKLKPILFDNVDISKVDHKVVANDDIISYLPFWDGISGKLSEDPDRAKLLFMFIIENIVENDNNWEKISNVNCTCKDKVHKIIPSQWLASLKADAWIPYKTTENGKEKIVKIMASKDNIRNLFPDKEFETLMRSYPNQLNKLLPHLGFDELELNITLQILKTGKTEVEIRKEASDLLILTDLADILPDMKELVVQDPNGFKEAIQQLKEKREKASIKDENKKIGENVEKIIELIFSEMGIKVVPIYRGGDLELWPEDSMGWDSGCIEIEPYTVEIKFTSSSSAHLSKVQSETSGTIKENYIVLVVENTNDLRERLQMNLDDNSILNDLKSDIINNSHIIKNIFSKLGTVPNPDELEPDIQGYWIKRKLWTNKENLVKWSKREFS